MPVSGRDFAVDIAIGRHTVTACRSTGGPAALLDLLHQGLPACLVEVGADHERALAGELQRRPCRCPTPRRSPSRRGRRISSRSTRAAPVLSDLAITPSRYTWTGCSRPLTWTSPCAMASPAGRRAARGAASDTSSWEPNCLLSCSNREARFTTSPMTVYSLRAVEPTVPVTASPGVQPDPDDRRLDLAAVAHRLDAIHDLEPGRRRSD